MEFTFTIAVIVMISLGYTSPNEIVKECVTLVTVPCAAGFTVTVSTVINVGKESETITSRIGAVPVLPAVMVNVKRWLTLAELGVTTTLKIANGVMVPVAVGVEVWVGVCVTVPVVVGVDVRVGVQVAVKVGVPEGVGVLVGVDVSVLIRVAVAVSVWVAVGVSVSVGDGSWSSTSLALADKIGGKMINMTNRLHKNIKPIGQKFGFRFLETFRRILSITWSPGRDLVSPISVFLIITPTNSLYCNQTAPYASKGCMRNEKSDD